MKYVLCLPVKENCKGTKHVEDWRMTPCRFCENYKEARKASGPLGGHLRAVSLPPDEPDRVAVGCKSAEC